MEIGTVIRKYRKQKNITQEEMAVRLGVTAPAVNKWENGNSLPDVSLLAPIARLLDITTDTLLSFEKNLTEEEINQIISEFNMRLKQETCEEAFQWAKKKTEQYPDCGKLLVTMAVMLEGQFAMEGTAEREKYDTYIKKWYLRALESEDENIRYSAADLLINFCIRKEVYDEAERYLEYLSDKDPEKKRKRGQIYSLTDRKEEAYREYEELLYCDYQAVSAALHGIYLLAIKENNLEKAREMTKKQKKLAELFEMGEYYQISGGLELAVLEQNKESVLQIAEKMLDSVSDIGSFSHADLYEHMNFRQIKKETIEELKERLKESFQDEETFGFMQGDERWEKLIF
ncbi:MAG: helix-turn-helix domain-containing protein [Ruminococcus sp.]|jgi:transcriptional regulator with XRE-family HTH domain